MDMSSNDDGREYSLFQVRPYKLAELAKIWGVSILTFRKWIVTQRIKVGKIVGHYLRIEQVEIIIAKLKLPYFVRVEISSEEQYEKKLDEKVGRLPEHLPKVSNKKNPPRKKTKRAVKKKRKAIKTRRGRNKKS